MADKWISFYKNGFETIVRFLQLEQDSYRILQEIGKRCLCEDRNILCYDLYYDELRNVLGESGRNMFVRLNELTDDIQNNPVCIGKKIDGCPSIKVE